MTKKILISTGDYSGKIYANKIIENLLNIQNDLEIYTTFKTTIKNDRIHTVCDLQELGVVGIIEVIPSLLYYYLELQKLKKVLKEEKINVLFPIDFPDFNFHLIKFAKENGIKVIYYVPPQLWAWRIERIDFLKKYVDLTLVLFKFEQELYRKYGLNCQFVGHPVIENIKIDNTKQKNAICFFPGSRISTIKQLLPLYLQLAEAIYCQFPMKAFIFGITHNISDKFLKKYKFTYPFKIQKINNAIELFPNCLLAIIPTGTISLETALCRVPAIVVNKTTYINYLLVKDKIKVKFLSLPNILAEEEIYPEFLQNKIDTEKILHLAEDFLDYPEKFDERFKKWEEIKKREFDYTNPIELTSKAITNFITKNLSNLKF